jgi:hypothetical protein
VELNEQRVGMQVLPTRQLKIPKLKWTAKHRTMGLKENIPTPIPSLNVGFNWYNELSHPIFIKHRDGSIVKIPSSPSNDRGGVLTCIRTMAKDHTCAFDHESNYDFGELHDDTSGLFKATAASIQLTEVLETYHFSPKIIKPNMPNPDLRQYHDRRVVNSKIEIAEEDLRSEDGVYFADIDVVIAKDAEVIKYAVHPGSNLGIRLAHKDNDVNDRLVFSMLLVDNEKKYGPRYTTVHGEHFLVESIEDLNRESGLYLMRTPSRAENDRSVMLIAKQYTVEEAEKLNILRKYRECEASDHKAMLEVAERAKAFQSVVYTDLDRKEKIAELERKVKEEANARAAVERRFDIEMAERIKAREEAARVNRRKDYVEYIKVALSVITLFLAYRKK